MKRKLAISIALALPAAPVLAASEYMTSIQSEVYQAQGSPSEIATRAATCMSQHLAPGSVDADIFINRDIEGGVIVARSALEYGSLPRWKIRSRFTFEAREGRFRIEQTSLERFNDQFNVGWGPIGKWSGSQWKKAEEAFVASADVVARCVTSSPAHDDW